MFGTIKKSGLSLAEFALIVSVSRVAVFNWRAGRANPHPQLRNRLDAAVKFLGQLTEMEKLPLPDGLSREERRAKIAKLKAAFERL